MGKNKSRQSEKNNKPEKMTKEEDGLKELADIRDEHDEGEHIKHVKHVKHQEQLEEMGDEDGDKLDSQLETLLECLQDTKCGRMRVKHWQTLCQVLSARYRYESLRNHQLTLVDIFERGLKASAEEIESTALAVSLTLINFGTSDDLSETIVERFSSLFKRHLIDSTLKPSVRSKCVQALAIGCSIVETCHETRLLMDQLLAIGMLSANHSGYHQTADFQAFQATCLEMFTFLACNQAVDCKHKLLLANCDKLKKALASPSLTIRLALGECIALLLTCVGVYRLEQDDRILDLYELLEELSTHHQKSQSKRQLRQQRSHFRVISKSIGEQLEEPEVIRFGCETLVLDTWTVKLQYQSLRELIGPGMHLHLKLNPFLRDIFGLGTVMLDEPIVLSKSDRRQRQNAYNSNRKCRELSRNKLRHERHLGLYE